jgi:hypothetical protein
MMRQKQILALKEAFELLGDILIRTSDAQQMARALQLISAVGQSLEVEAQGSEAGEKQVNDTEGIKK